MSSPPPGLNDTVSIQQALPFILINACFTSVLLPIFFALLFFSTPKSRRTVIFALNVVAVILGFAEGILSLVVEVYDLLKPLHTLPQIITTARFIAFFYTLLLVETVLVLRLVAVFPSRTYAFQKICLVLAFPVVAKIVRVVALSLLASAWCSLTRKTGNALEAGRVVFRDPPWVKVAWISQVLDNTYASMIFIYRLRVHKKGFEVYTGKVIISRLHTVLLIAVSNYVFPTLLSLAQLVLAFRDRMTKKDNDWFIHNLYVLNANTFVTILGVVFATVWTSCAKWAYLTGLTEDDLQRTMSVLRAGGGGGVLGQPRHVLSMQFEGEEGGPDWQSYRRPSSFSTREHVEEAPEAPEWPFKRRRSEEQVGGDPRPERMRSASLSTQDHGEGHPNRRPLSTIHEPNKP